MFTWAIFEDAKRDGQSGYTMRMKIEEKSKLFPRIDQTSSIIKWDIDKEA